jgi:ABC-type phosphate transport system ATPase subunit
MNNSTSITYTEIKSLKLEGKIEFIGNNEFQVNNQGNYTFNEISGIFKQQNSSPKVIFHKIATFIK